MNEGMVFPLIKETLSADELLSMYLTDAELIFEELHPALARLAFDMLMSTKRMFEVDETEKD